MRLLVPDARPMDEGELVDLYDAGADGLLRAGFVQSADGAIAVGGSSRGLQTPADLAAFRALRAVSDAVVVGAGTARQEDYGPVRLRPELRAWRAAHGRSDAPRLVVVTRSGRLGTRQREAAPLVVTTARGAEEAGDLDVLVAGVDVVDLRAAVTALRDRGLDRLLCEGGPTLLGDLAAAGLVDELCLTTSPLLVGGAAPLLPSPLPSPLPLELVHLVDGGDGALLQRWRVRR